MAPQSSTRNDLFPEGPRKCRYSGCESRQKNRNCLSSHESRCEHRHGIAKKPAGVKKKAKAAPAAAPKKTLARKTTGNKASKPAPASVTPPAPAPAVAPSPATEAAATTLAKVADAPSDAPREASEGRRLRSSGGGGGSEAAAATGDQNVSPAAGE
jgi:hypothetical protein